MIRAGRISLKFPRPCRLTLASEFNLVKTSGKSWTGRHLVMATLAREDPAQLKIGIITTRRVGPAVTRNRIRRRIREIFRLNQERVQKGNWLVTIARRSSADATYGELEKDWLRLAERAAILSPPIHEQNSPDPSQNL